MQNIKVFKVTCHGCGCETRVPGLEPAMDLVDVHAEHGRSVTIRRVWLHALTPAIAA